MILIDFICGALLVAIVAVVSFVCIRDLTAPLPPPFLPNRVCAEHWGVRSIPVDENGSKIGVVCLDGRYIPNPNYQ